MPLMKLTLLPLAIAFTTLFGCRPPNQDLATTTSAIRATTDTTAAGPPPPKAVKSNYGEWTATLNSAYAESDVKSAADGTSRSDVCFLPKPQCALRMRGARDAFRKVRHFHGTAVEAYADRLTPSLGVYIALKDCSRPTLFVNPTYAGKSWIFLEQVAILVGADVAFEAEIKSVDRDAGSMSVLEIGHAVVSAANLDSLKKVADADEFVVRLSGSKGFATLSNAQRLVFRQNLKAALAAFHRLSTATSGFEGPCGT